MNEYEFNTLINYIVDRGIKAIHDNTEETSFAVDYVAIFSKNDAEFQDLLAFARTLGTETDKITGKTGVTIKLYKSIPTKAGVCSFVKIRKPDPTRPQRGAPDFKIDNYTGFKQKYLQTSGNFTLMVRKDYELIELKGVDVLVYFPSKLAEQRV
ncbi:MAG: hypothetical protein V1743_04305 [Nanoarchaeota archaeon]